MSARNGIGPHKRKRAPFSPRSRARTPRQTALTYGRYRLSAVPTPLQRAVVEFVSMTTRVSIHSLRLSLKKWKRACELWTREKKRRKKANVYIYIYVCVYKCEKCVEIVLSVLSELPTVRCLVEAEIVLRVNNWSIPHGCNKRVYAHRLV